MWLEREMEIDSSGQIVALRVSAGVSTIISSNRLHVSASLGPEILGDMNPKQKISLEEKGGGGGGEKRRILLVNT